MIKVVLFGFGNVGRHLYKAFTAASGVAVLQVYNRSRVDFSFSSDTEFTTDISEIKKADVYIIALSDDAIASFSSALPFEDRLVVHTSGAVTLNDLNDKNRKGVFYPLQTFSKNTQVDFSSIPIAIEAVQKEDHKLIEHLAHSLSEKIVTLTSEERKVLHLAAVFSNNFVNHMYHISEEILAQHQLDFDLLKPLIMETARKVQTMAPKQAQTGPARRNDQDTIDKHLELLERKSDQKLYKTITKSIAKNHGKKL